MKVALGTAFEKALEHDASSLPMDGILTEDFIRVMKSVFDGILKEIPKEDMAKPQTL